MRREVRFLSLAAALMMAVVIPALSQTTPQASALDEVRRARSSGDDVTNDPKWRASLATALHRYCESVMAQVPRNTPQEDRWVDDELKDIIFPSPSMNMDLKKFEEGMNRNNARLRRLNGSLEFARKELRRILSTCSRLTDQLTASKSPAAEALLWAELSRYFMVEDFVWDMAEKVGIISPKYCKHVSLLQVDDLDLDATDSGYDENNICYWQNVGITIHLGAVIPLLKDIAKR
jgi:hypothetical protein